MLRGYKWGYKLHLLEFLQLYQHKWWTPPPPFLIFTPYLTDIYLNLNLDFLFGDWFVLLNCQPLSGSAFIRTVLE